METGSTYDVVIAGGGLAGLSCAIQLNRLGHSVLVLEKEQYPFHKVCGEYMSMESWNYLKHLGMPLDQLNLPLITKLHLTSPGGRSFKTQLPLGGFGISRFLLEKSLVDIARSEGITILENHKVEKIDFNGHFSTYSGSRVFNSVACCAAYGKHSNLDIKWRREYLENHDKRLDNFIAVKYHVKCNWPAGVIGLHNFNNGYCGISKIENDRYCLCYMTRADELRRSGNNIKQLEEQVLYKNPALKKIFEDSLVEKDFPITISQINFHHKSRVEQHVLMLGDAGGMITPLCGNGMSIALHTGKMAARQINHFLDSSLNRLEMERAYEKEWRQQFSRRFKSGRLIQKFFGSPFISEVFVQSFKAFPFMAGPVVKLTHGKAF